ncbi:CinA family protein [Micromonospora inyonensis]|uniref:Nicotinamide-nucleotide amidase n=1 Tax=Micromonospora inyonensis TaxID=47866 RepID=A0A1C6RQD6_9ACTN|nr:CinA family protein [Micromonospora inyonensis]SCL19363.1 nicotinamide-nucleotide amidase [Micromonospora inyonensis]
MLPEEIVANLFKRHGLTLATAESLTGGMVGERVTSVPGASAYYLGGVITYATEAKRDVLGVSADVLRTDGPVSSRAASEMALRASERFGSSVGVATTGVAGPAMQDGHPVGTLFVGICCHGQVRCLPFRGPDGSREEIRRWASEMALNAVIDAVRDARPVGDR